jgi:hypothetical protein
MMAMRARQAAAERKLVVDRTNAPGNKRAVDSIAGGRPDKPLRNTNRNLAYFGTVAMNTVVGNFTTFRNATANAGANINTAEVWLKFAHNGKILFVARKNLTQGISWNQIYNRGCVGRVGTNGIAPGRGGVESNSTAQNMTYSSGGVTYDVRLLTAAPNAIETTNGQSSGLYTFNSGGEWDQLITSVSEFTSYNKRGWALFSNAILGIRTDSINGFRQNGTASWTQNSAGTTAGFSQFNAWGAGGRGFARVLRGFGGRRHANQQVTAIAQTDLSRSDATTYSGPNGPPGTGGGNVSRSFVSWRPVLEVRLASSGVDNTFQTSGGGRGGGWKGVPRNIPNNAGWTGI